MHRAPFKCLAALGALACLAHDLGSGARTVSAWDSAPDDIDIEDIGLGDQDGGLDEGQDGGFGGLDENAMKAIRAQMAAAGMGGESDEDMPPLNANMFSGEEDMMAGELGDEAEASTGTKDKKLKKKDMDLNVEKDLKKVPFQPPAAPSHPQSVLLLDTFQDASEIVDTPDSGSAWKKLTNKKFSGEWAQGALRMKDWIVGDRGLKMMTDSAFHGLARELEKTWSSRDEKALFGTMEVQFEKTHNCGGAYLKFFDVNKLDSSASVADFDDSTSYSLMFGPDRCGHMSNKVHLIVKFDAKNDHGELVEASGYEEHLVSPARIPADLPKASHQYAFALTSAPRNKDEANKDTEKENKDEPWVEMWVDGVSVYNGSMRESFKTGFATPEMVPDMSVEQPADWPPKMIDDPQAQKPEDWDEDAPRTIPDEDAVMPDDWLVDEAPLIPNPDAAENENEDEDEDEGNIEEKKKMIPNPKCQPPAASGCGEWTPPMKANPAYKGKWKAPQVPNPLYKPWERPQKTNEKHFKVDDIWSVVRPFNAAGFELWTVESGAVFDNIFLTTNEQDFHDFVAQTYGRKKGVEKDNFDVISRAHANQTRKEKETKKTKDHGKGGIAKWTRVPAQLVKSFGLHMHSLQIYFVTVLRNALPAKVRSTVDEAADYFDGPYVGLISVVP